MLFSRISGFDSDNLNKLPAGSRWNIEIFSIWAFISILLCSASASYIFFVSTKSYVISALAAFTVFICFLSIQSLLISNRGKQIGENITQEESDKINNFHSLIYLLLTVLFTQPILLYVDHQLYSEKITTINQLEYDIRIQTEENLYKDKQNEIKYELALIRERINSLGGDLSTYISTDDLQIISNPEQQGNSGQLNNPHSPRKALIIGNRKYAPPNGALENPINDANGMKKNLEKMGFQVTVLYDVKIAEMEFQIKQFVNSLQAGDISLIYYSGHGIQQQGANYMFPIDNEPYLINKYLSQVSSKKVLASIVILDACRGDGKTIERSGFDTSGAGQSFFIGLAASAGETSSDGPKGGNGAFTGALLRYINLKADIKDVFEKAKQEVIKAGYGQHPDYIDQLNSSFILAQPESKPTGPNSNPSNTLPTKPLSIAGLSCNKEINAQSSEADKAEILSNCVAEFLKLLDDLKITNEISNESKLALVEKLKKRFEGELFNPMYFYKYIWSNSRINNSDESNTESTPVSTSILLSLLIWAILAGGFLIRENLSKAQLQYRQFRNEEDTVSLYSHFEIMSKIAKDQYKKFRNEVKSKISSSSLIREDIYPDLPHPFLDSKDALERKNKYLRTGNDAFNYLYNSLKDR